MEKILETSRLYLRQMTDDDFEPLKAVISDPENMIYYPKPYDDDGVRRWIAWCKDCYAKYGFGLWAVIEKESGQMIGDCGISMQPIDDGWKPEIGYHLRRDKHRLGLGKEMTQAVRDYFFTHFDYGEVYSYMNKDNVPSYKTAEANGMDYLHLYKHGDEECRVYSITREKWSKMVRVSPEEMWKASGLSGEYEAWAFSEASDKLARLVLEGIKTATCSVYDLYEAEGEELPKEGSYSIILDSFDRAVCIIMTTKVYVAPFSSCTEEHAYKEGEGDRSLAYWREVHEEFAKNELSSIGKDFDESVKLVYEEFEVVYK